MTASGGAPTTGFYLPRAAALHDPGWGHRDHQGRLRALTSALGRHMPVLAGRVRQEEGDPASRELLLLAHEGVYLDRLRDAALRAEEEGRPSEWGGVRVSGGSWEAAVGTAGATVAAARAVARGDFRNAFVVGRPPGHGAGPGGPSGYSLLNHVAVAARALQAEGRAHQILVVDWDVHPPAGTEAILREDSGITLLTVDEEGQPAGGPRTPDGGDGEGEPAVGAPAEGDGETEGMVREVVPRGAAREEYLERFAHALRRAVSGRRFDFVIVSAGLDVLAADPVGGQALVPADLHAMMTRLGEEARGTGAERVVGVLEGGYDPASTGEGVAQVLRSMAGLPPGGP